MTEETGKDAPESRRRVWPKLLLAGSLTLNVLVLSVIAGAHFRDGRPGPEDRKIASSDKAVLRQGGFTPFFDAMPRETRARLTDALRENGVGPDRAALANDFRDFIAAVRAEPFDPAACNAVLEAQHARAEERVRIGREVLVEQIEAMSPGERIAFADSLEKRFRDALARAPRKPENTAPPKN